MDGVTKKLWAIGGGKGGVGKSIVTLMLGTSLARIGKKVVVVDADLGGSNLHTLAGIRYPLYTLADYINRQVEKIEDVMMKTPIENLHMICGADDILGIANPKSTQKTRLFNNLKRIDADFILLDLGAGTSFTTIDFFLFAPNKIVVFTPQITSIQNAYGFIKASLYRKLDIVFRKEPECRSLIKRAGAAADTEGIDSIEKLKDTFRNMGEHYEAELVKTIEELKINILVNMVREPKEREVGNIVKTVAGNYLSLDLDALGVVQFDNVLSRSINNMAKFLQEKRDTAVSIDFYDIANKIIRLTQQAAAPQQPGFSVKVPASRL
jgi:flagellar biosynthesis protein FlhG